MAAFMPMTARSRQPVESDDATTIRHIMQLRTVSLDNLDMFAPFVSRGFSRILRLSSGPQGASTVGVARNLFLDSFPPCPSGLSTIAMRSL